jgi:hypothetical protein
MAHTEDVLNDVFPGTSDVIVSQRENDGRRGEGQLPARSK